MVYEVQEDTNEDVIDRTERLHEFLLNQQGYDTEDVLVVGRSNGRITVEVEDQVAENDTRRIRGLIADLHDAIVQADWNEMNPSQMSDALDLLGWLDRLEP